MESYRAKTGQAFLYKKKRTLLFYFHHTGLSVIFISQLSSRLGVRSQAVCENFDNALVLRIVRYKFYRYGIRASNAVK